MVKIQTTFSVSIDKEEDLDYSIFQYSDDESYKVFDMFQKHFETIIEEALSKDKRLIGCTFHISYEMSDDITGE